MVQEPQRNRKAYLDPLLDARGTPIGNALRPMEVFIPHYVIAEITERKRYSAQFKALCRMGFSPIKTPSGVPKVTWDNFKEVTKGSVSKDWVRRVVLNPDAV